MHENIFFSKIHGRISRKNKLIFVPGNQRALTRILEKTENIIKDG